MATNAVQIKEVGKWRKMQQARENGNGSESTKIEVESGENFPLMVSDNGDPPSPAQALLLKLPAHIWD